jgi:DNA-binding HxlR family transcriptional regulator
MTKFTKDPDQGCRTAIRSVRDSVYVLGGKWKISIIACLLYGTKRYSDILREITGISGKVLTRELKEMEVNLLLKRIVSETSPVSVSYELTDYGNSVRPVIEILAEWGETHRESIRNHTEL